MTQFFKLLCENISNTEVEDNLLFNFHDLMDEFSRMSEGRVVLANYSLFLEVALAVCEHRKGDKIDPKLVSTLSKILAQIVHLHKQMDAAA